MADNILLQACEDIDATHLTFPNLTEYIESLHSLSEINDSYISELTKGNVYHLAYANKLREYRDILNLDNLFHLENDFFKLKKSILNFKIENGIDLPISITKRRKNFIGLNEKIRLSLLKALKEPSNTTSLSQILDILGFRIIIGNENNTLADEQNSVDLCYTIINNVIIFFIELGYTPIQIDFKKSHFDKGSFPNLVLPSNTEHILPGFENCVKDYIKYPKSNGYQSLHIVFQTKTGGLSFEIQVRTQAMQYHAEYDIASHLLYNEKKYKDVKITFDPLKTNIKGYKAQLDPNNNLVIVDQIGLTSSDISDPFNIIF